MKLRSPLKSTCHITANPVPDAPRAFSFGPRLNQPAVLLAAIVLLLVYGAEVNAQSSDAAQPAHSSSDISRAIVPTTTAADRTAREGDDASVLLQEIREMRRSIEELRTHVNELETQVNQLQAERRGGGASNASMQPTGGTPEPAALSSRAATANAPHPLPGASAEATGGPAGASDAGTPPSPASDLTQAKEPAGQDRAVLDFLHDATINLALDTYYDYNFNHPIGRVNLLRAFDVLSNAFSLNQADVIFEYAPDVEAGRRFGARLDLQFGQATDTLQGNPANEPRPEIYRNIFQAYGTYIIPVGNGVTVDFGKWSSSLGIEGNYTKDQINYSRSFWFDFLPFYHMGLRANYQVNDKFAVNYWVTNGTQQTEPFNSFKDELFGFVVKPVKAISWTVNYYLGQEHPDVTPVANTTGLPLQPGLSFEPIIGAPTGRLDIFDSYVTWQVTPRLSFAGEGDYVIERLFKDSAPQHTDGGAGYVRYEISPHFAVGGRSEYLSDRGGLFSGRTQALKEETATFDYKIANGFLMRYEWRRDFSNVPYFFTGAENVFKKEQTTATVGLIWWWGRKEGPW